MAAIKLVCETSKEEPLNEDRLEALRYRADRAYNTAARLRDYNERSMRTRSDNEDEESSSTVDYSCEAMMVSNSIDVMEIDDKCSEVETSAIEINPDIQRALFLEDNAPATMDVDENVGRYPLVADEVVNEVPRQWRTSTSIVHAGPTMLESEKNEMDSNSDMSAADKQKRFDELRRKTFAKYANEPPQEKVLWRSGEPSQNDPTTSPKTSADSNEETRVVFNWHEEVEKQRQMEMRWARDLDAKLRKDEELKRMLLEGPVDVENRGKKRTSDEIDQPKVVLVGQETMAMESIPCNNSMREGTLEEICNDEGSPNSQEQDDAPPAKRTKLDKDYLLWVKTEFL